MMMITNHLLRELAPITDDGWTYLDEEATARLSVALGARKLVDFTGPLRLGPCSHEHRPRRAGRRRAG